MNFIHRLWELAFRPSLSEAFSEEAQTRAALHRGVVTERQFQAEMQAYIRKCERRGFCWQQ